MAVKTDDYVKTSTSLPQENSAWGRFLKDTTNISPGLVNEAISIQDRKAFFDWAQKRGINRSSQELANIWQERFPVSTPQGSIQSIEQRQQAASGGVDFGAGFGFGNIHHEQLPKLFYSTAEQQAYEKRKVLGHLGFLENEKGEIVQAKEKKEILFTPEQMQAKQKEIEGLKEALLTKNLSSTNPNDKNNYNYRSGIEHDVHWHAVKDLVLQRILSGKDQYFKAENLQQYFTDSLDPRAQNWRRAMEDEIIRQFGPQGKDLVNKYRGIEKARIYEKPEYDPAIKDVHTRIEKMKKGGIIDAVAQRGQWDNFAKEHGEKDGKAEKYAKFSEMKELQAAFVREKQWEHEQLPSGEENDQEDQEEEQEQQPPQQPYRSSSVDTLNRGIDKAFNAYDMFKKGEWIKNLFRGGRVAQTATTVAEGAEIAETAAGVAEGGALAAEGGVLAGAAGGGAAAGTAAAGTAAVGAGGTAAAASSPVWVPIVATIAVVAIIIFLIILLLLFFGGGDLSGKPEEIGGSAPILGLTIDLTGPPSLHVENGQEIPYAIKATYTGNSDVTIFDEIPSNATYKTGSATGVVSEPGTGNNFVSWNLKANEKNATVTKDGKIYTFSITLLPKENDSRVSNTIISSVPGLLGQTGGSCPTAEQLKANSQSPETCKYLNPGIDIFDTNFSEDQIKHYVATYGQGGSEFETKVRTIVQEAKSVGLNPIIPLGYWRTESRFGNGFGCPKVPPDFRSQVDCILGGPAGSAWSDKYSVAAGCARSKDANSPACLEEKSIRDGNAKVYGKIPISLLIRTFDDLAEAIGSRAPDLEVYLCSSGQDPTACKDPVNRNCIHTYNELIDTAESVNACKVSAAPAASNIAACLFYRNDQVPGSSDCPPGDQGFRCDKGLTYKSPLLLSYIQEVAQKTGIPASVLGGLVRIESTVPERVSATKKSYSISDYSDDDIRAMEKASLNKQVEDIDQTIGNSNKALCPRSPTGALGLTQVQPPKHLHDALRANDNRIGTFESINAYNYVYVAKGAALIGKGADDLTFEDFCDPKKSLYLGAGFILGIVGGKWNPPTDQASYQTYIDTVAKNYYGQDSQTSSYGASLWESVRSCQENAAPNASTVQAPAISDYKNAIFSEFSVTMNNFDDQHLKWAYDKFKDVSKTNFSKLIKGATINNSSGLYSFTDAATCIITLVQAQANLPNNIGENEEELFKITLIHELGHFISNSCSHVNNSDNLFNDASNLPLTHQNVYDEKGDRGGEGPLTYYAAHAEWTNVCNTDGTTRNVYRRSEDYADMIAYYLNQNVKTKKICDDSGRYDNPYNSGKYPMHKELVEKILGKYP